MNRPRKSRPAPTWESLQFAFIGTSLLSWYAVSLWSEDQVRLLVALVFTVWAMLADLLTLLLMWRWVREHDGRNRSLLFLQVFMLLAGAVLVMLFWPGSTSG